VTDAGKARSARNGTRHGLRGGPFALLPGEDREEFAALHAAVTSDWSPRDAYERRWVMELVTSMWRQDRLRGLELATLGAAAESPPSEATIRKLGTFARYGARIDKDIGRALQALRVLRTRPDEWIDELQNDTCEPAAFEPREQDGTNQISTRTSEPELAAVHAGAGRPELDPDPMPSEGCTPEPGRPLNRHQRRALTAMVRRRAA
jgi:hypothetical protein